ncbi:hypothetical protein D3C81_868670 [compost metagenome]
MALDVEAVLQAQRAEFLFGQFAGEEAAGLVAELRDALLDDPLIVLVVYVHVILCSQAVSEPRRLWPARMVHLRRARLRTPLE